MDQPEPLESQSQWQPPRRSQSQSGEVVIDVFQDAVQGPEPSSPDQVKKSVTFDHDPDAQAAAAASTSSADIASSNSRSSSNGKLKVSFGEESHNAGTNPADAAAAPRGILKRELENSSAEEDPYYGLGSDPAEPLPPLSVALALMESRRFKKQRTPAQEFGVRVMIFITTVTAASCFIFCFVLFAAHVRNHPRPPILMSEFSVSMIYHIYPVNPELIRRQQQEGKGNYYAFYLNWVFLALMNLTNPNTHVDLSYDFLEVTLFYRGFQIAFDRIDNFTLPRGVAVKPFFSLFAISLKVPLDVGTTMKHELDRRDFMVVSEFVARGSMILLPGLKPMVFWTRYRCRVHSKVYIFDSDCELLSAKWRPNNAHFPYYRKSYWTSFADPFYSFHFPEAYYDYDYNLYLPLRSTAYTGTIGSNSTGNTTSLELDY